ncbi:MAG: M81 family metallopeptidase [Chloroflexi bacterium]|nr:M81 family metallopeptidase [Chloroflexota bacterium]
MRIAIFEIRQETNTFNPVITKIEDYEQGGIFEGVDMYKSLKGTSSSVNGMFSAIEEIKGEIIPIYSMIAQSGGCVEHSVIDHFIEKITIGIEENLPLDGVFVSLHGATQSTMIDDVCGMILEKTRNLVGENSVISVSTDLHANVTEKMARNADFICAYHTYPHVDFFETGYRAAKLGITKILGNKNLKMAWVTVPMIVPASSYTTLHGPFSELMSYCESLIESGELYDFSIHQMQPWLDVKIGGSAIITVATDIIKAKSYAEKIAKKLMSNRHEFSVSLYSIDEVIWEAEKNKSGKPYILVDAADSPNAGACGDSAEVLSRILELGSDVKTAFYINDSKAVEKAFLVGVGNTDQFSIGSTIDQVSSKPVLVEALVRSLHDGIFTQEGPSGRFLKNNIGRTAVLSVGNIDIIVCKSILAPGDPQIYRHFGIEPTFYQLVNIKANTSFRVAYEPISEKIFETDTPGVGTSILEKLPYKRIPRTFFPFSEIDETSIKSSIVFR